MTQLEWVLDGHARRLGSPIFTLARQKLLLSYRDDISLPVESFRVITKEAQPQFADLHLVFSIAIPFVRLANKQIFQTNFLFLKESDALTSSQRFR